MNGSLEQTFALLLHRERESHKNTYGHVLLLAGARGTSGAALLAGKAALRTGAGLVTVATEQAVTNVIEGKVPELMMLALPDDQAKASETLNEYVKTRKATVLALGPGLTSPFGQSLVTPLLEGTSLPAVTDGGAITAIAKNGDSLLRRKAPCVLTPHRGEFRRLLSLLPEAEQTGDTHTDAARLANRYDCELVLKGSPTHVFHPDGTAYINTTGGPGLATAGSGDVLTGIVAALIAQGIHATQAAEAGVYLHGLAGDIATRQKSAPGVIASDIIKSLPAAYLAIASEIGRA